LNTFKNYFFFIPSFSQFKNVKMDFILSQQAKSKGGDKYISVEDPTFSIYVPQSISRVDKLVHQRLLVTIKPVPSTVPAKTKSEDIV
jgi:hypothetical protein